MKFHVLTLFPEMITDGMRHSIIGKAIEKHLITIDAVNIRDYTQEKHGKVDDYTYGGGAGMLMQAQPVYDAHLAVCAGKKLRTVYVTPQGVPFTQRLAAELAGEEELVFLCGHYEGIDERALEEIVTDPVSIGDYVLTGGELAAMVMIDAIARLVPGVLHNTDSAFTESFHNDLLEYPQYSRPEVWHGKRVPEVLLSGNHSKIEAWRLAASLERTRRVRPDLYEKYQYRQQILQMLMRHKRENGYLIDALMRGTAQIVRAGEGAALGYCAGDGVWMLCCQEPGEGEALLEGLKPEEVRRMVHNCPPLTETLTKRFGLSVYGACVQTIYPPKNTLPVKYKDIRPLVDEAPGERLTQDESIWRAHMGYRERFGVYEGEALTATGGFYAWGGIGVDSTDSPQEASLLAFLVNRALEKGGLPAIHIPIWQALPEGLSETSGFYRAEKPAVWLGKT